MIAQAEIVAKELLTQMTSEQLVLVSHIDKDLIQTVVTSDHALERLEDETGVNKTLINYMMKILNRIKQSNFDQGLKLSEQGLHFDKKRAIHGPQESQQYAFGNIDQEDHLSDLDDFL